MKGTYILLVELGEDARVRTGSLGEIEFRKGFYAYVGSGMGSLEKRIERHAKRRKKKFWHVDYLLAKAKTIRVVSWEAKERHECEAAGRLAQKFENAKDFGCSDCGCGSHLFYSESFPKLEKEAQEISRSFRAPRFLLRTPKPSVSSF